jgi:hypothetical protein
MVRGNLTAIISKDKRDLHILTNMYRSPTGGNLRPITVDDYRQHMVYINKKDRTANSYSVTLRTWKWIKKKGGKLFLLLHLTTQNTCIIPSSWLWVKIFWNSVQGSLILNPLQEENQT